MAESSDFEKKRVVLDVPSTDDRSTAEGQVCASEVQHADLNTERRYGEYGCKIFI